mmetsp:Transcript_60700/g.104543  ORF Transcript_60700/g.104543 Transcript_60700/m.104543 type:complete len:350 (+) Transcript_60700:354-1403(+)
MSFRPGGGGSFDSFNGGSGGPQSTPWSNNRQSPNQPLSQSSQAGGSSGVWPLLCRELSLTSEQADNVRKVVRRLRDNSTAAAEERSLSLLCVHLERLHSHLNSCASNAQAKWSQVVKGVLSPSQAVVYLGWVARNGERLERARLEEEVVAGACPTTTQSEQQTSQSQQAAGKRERDGGGPTSSRPPTAAAAAAAAAEVESSGRTASSSPDNQPPPTLPPPHSLSFGDSPQGRATVTALLRKDPDALSLDDVEFLLNCLRKAQVAKVSTGRQHPWTVPAVAPSSSSNSSSANSWGQAQTPRGGSGCEQRGVAAGGDFHGGGEQERAEAGGGRGFSIGGDEVSESPDGLCD